MTMDTIAQVIHEYETCAAIKQAKRLKPLWLNHERGWACFEQGVGLGDLHPEVPPSLHDSMI